MKESNSTKEMFNVDHLGETFYPSNGEIFTNKKKAFNIENAITSFSMPKNSKLPLNIFFGEIKINEIKSVATTNCNIIKNHYIILFIKIKNFL